MREEKGNRPLPHPSSLVPRPFSLLLLLVRHGETTWNAQGRLQGHRDVALSDRGREQARRLAHRLRAAWQEQESGKLLAAAALPGPPRHIFSSDLGRAVETAAILRDEAVSAAALAENYTLPAIQTTPLLRERGFGSWEGLTPAEARARFPGTDEPADGERWTDAYTRIGQALEWMWQKAVPITVDESNTASAASDVALVVGHGGTLRAVLSHALEADVETVRRFHLDNVSLSIVEFRGETWDKSRGRILVVNDTAHLFSVPSA